MVFGIAVGGVVFAENCKIIASFNKVKIEDTVSKIILFTKDELAPEAMEVFERLMLEDESLKDSVHRLGELDWDKIYVEVTDVTTTETTASTYSRKDCVSI